MEVIPFKKITVSRYTPTPQPPSPTPLPHNGHLARGGRCKEIWAIIVTLWKWCYTGQFAATIFNPISIRRSCWNSASVSTRCTLCNLHLMVGRGKPREVNLAVVVMDNWVPFQVNSSSSDLIFLELAICTPPTIHLPWDFPSRRFPFFWETVIVKKT